MLLLYLQYFFFILKWLFKNYENTTLALLTGFIFGSLNKIWPWKETVSVLNEHSGNTISFSEVSNLGTLAIYQKNMEDFDTYKTVLEQSVLPSTYAQINGGISSELGIAIVLMISGFLTIFILEKLGRRAS